MSGECPACGHDSSSYLGRLGRLLWFRCVACGMDWNREPDDWQDSCIELDND